MTRSTLLLLAVLATTPAVSAIPANAAEPRLNKALNEQIVFVNSGSGLFGGQLETTIFKPNGDGPFPLVVINHGKEFGNPRFQPRARYIVASREFVRRGYAVLIPMRSGFSRSSGGYVEGGCYIAGNGMAQAADVRAALDFAGEQPYVDRRRVIVVGQSHGGLTTMAFGTSPYPGVLGLVNFAGGLRLNNCHGWADSLAAAFGEYGANNRYPTLWFYGDNDSYWSKEVVADMHSRYVGAGGKARLVSFGAFKDDAHKLFSDQKGLPVWWPEVERFLAGLGLPVTPPATPEAADDPALRRLVEAGQAAAIQASERCRNLYQTFIDADYPRAFAVSGDGRCGYAWGGEDPNKRAIDFCRGKTDKLCELYAVDDEVVWSGKAYD